MSFCLLFHKKRTFPLHFSISPIQKSKKMNKIFLVVVCLYLSLFNAEALSKKKALNSNTVAAAVAPKVFGTFLETETGFELINFYEYTFYVQAYELYNEYALNAGTTCTTVKRQYWFTKKTDAVAIANFCSLIGSQIGSSYLSSYLCGYISGLIPFFKNCTY